MSCEHRTRKPSASLGGLYCPGCKELMLKEPMSELRWNLTRLLRCWPSRLSYALHLRKRIPAAARRRSAGRP